jgi:hypothetical protein
VPARGGGGGLLNGLNSDSDDEDDDEDSDELMAIKNTGNRLGGQQQFFAYDNSRYQSVFNILLHIHEKNLDQL